MTEAASPAEATAVAAVIVNYRTKELTMAAARSVGAEDLVREIVIVDNASGDGSVEYLREHLDDWRAQVLEAPSNLGFGQGVNLALRHCSAPLVFILNSDATVVPGAMAVLARTLVDNPDVAVVAPAVYDAATGDLQPVSHGVFPTLKAIFLRTNTHPPETLFPDWVSGVAMMVRRQDFEAIGGFDPDFHMYLEDVDLCRRFRAAGQVVRRELTASVLHHGAQSWGSFMTASRSAQRSRVLYYRKAGANSAERVAIGLLRGAHFMVDLMPSRRSTLLWSRKPPS